MIIGAILETAPGGSGSQTANLNGAAMVHFYSMQDAIEWARVQSEEVIYGSSDIAVRTLCTVVNTKTGQRRWWYSGIEYTG